MCTAIALFFADKSLGPHNNALESPSRACSSLHFSRSQNTCVTSQLMRRERVAPLQVIDAEAALKAGMAKVSELESKAAAAPEPVGTVLYTCLCNVHMNEHPGS